jgi:cyclopropane fatty-acyl-phospholipid synthase-like methyltransferase
MENSTDTAHAMNRRTVSSYEGCARAYADEVGPDPSEISKQALQRLVRLLEPGARVLEIGSGPGWDADYMETLGITVRRTDAAQAFCDFQAERGKHADRIDVIADDLGGPYQGAVALYVLQHIDRTLIASVLQKIAAAIQPLGLFLLTIKEGSGESVDRGEEDGEYHVVRWLQDDFFAQLNVAGLNVEWHVRKAYPEGTWLSVLARKRM